MIPNPRWTLARQVACLCVFAGLAVLALCVTVWLETRQVAQLADDVAARRLPQLERIAEIELSVTRASLQLRHAILARNADERDTALKDVAAKRELIERRLAEYGAAATSPEGKAAYAPLPGLWNEFLAQATENQKSILAGDREGAFAMLADKTVPARNRLLAPLDKEKERQSGIVRREMSEVGDQAREARASVLAGVAVVAAALAVLAWRIVGIVRALGGEPATLHRVAESVAGGDLSVPIPVRPGDSRSIMAAFKTMSEQLATTVRTVRQNAEGVVTASREIAAGGSDLSTRTESQAAALEQTAASMEELNGTVQLNSSHAQQARQVAETSAQLARSGGELVGSAVRAMGAIGESSKRITEITGVIDGIAFQTNILALNAAVEAARAGEQGRGFAIVASEVRALATRSAEAARQIKQLITESEATVNRGTDQVGSAGTAMQDIVTSIERVNALVTDISRATGEQSHGMAEMDKAISQLDATTQQNAALVEQSAAASESLSRQAAELLEAVAIFRLGQRASA